MITKLPRAILVAAGLLLAARAAQADELDQIFDHPPAAAKPRVMWMWMGCHVSQAGITRDLESLHEAGFGGALLFHLTDVPTTWSADIGKSPTPEVITWSEPWWKLVRHAAVESQRLGLDLGMGNCAGYGTSGGPWITPELSMQQICWSERAVNGPGRLSVQIAQPQVDPRAINPWPVYNSDLGKEEKPVIPARNTFYRDIAVLALPATGTVALGQVINLSDKLGPAGQLDWEVPAGNWTLYRFGHTTMGTLQFPAQWKINGLECDKMNPEAVAFHADHVIREIKKHLGDLPGNGLKFLHFDSYEAGPEHWTPEWPYWTPMMPAEFSKRKGYDLTPFLPVLANRTIEGEKESKGFRTDFEATIQALYRDSYFATLSRKLHEAGLSYSCEPYPGPWKVPEVTPFIDRVVAEFWSDSGKYRDFWTAATIAAARHCGRNLIEAEAFTSEPAHSLWTEYPGMLKSVGDVAFCEGINRFVVHRFVHQPWDERYRPGFAMGQWGTHFDRTQTWWNYAHGLVSYWQRCQALLQWGQYTGDTKAFAVIPLSGGMPSTSGEKSALTQPRPRFIQRRDDSADLFFVANTDTAAGGKVTCSFATSGRQPELWDPVTGIRRELPQFELREGHTLIPLEFAPAQSWFVVFRKPLLDNSPATISDASPQNFVPLSQASGVDGPWRVSFDPSWGGPPQPVTFNQLEDWTKRPEPGIRYYSGTAVYRTEFALPASSLRHPKSRTLLDFGGVHHVARVRLNGQDLGLVWTAPWQVDISNAVRQQVNQLEVEVANVWANRLIGDEQEPADCVWYPVSPANQWCLGTPLKELPDWLLNGEPRPSRRRYCITTWRYNPGAMSLVPSGLLGPVRVIVTN